MFSSFFLLITSAFGAIQNFASPILQALYGLTITSAASALSAYLFGGAGGILLGGFLAKKGDQERLISVALGFAAALAIISGARHFAWLEHPAPDGGNWFFVPALPARRATCWSAERPLQGLAKPPSAGSMASSIPGWMSDWRLRLPHLAN